MRVAYLASRYPAVSHTFILREVQALRGRGLDIGTFSVRRATSGDVLGEDAAAEARHTRWLVPVGTGDAIRGALWALFRRPRRALGTLGAAIGRLDLSLIQRFKWACYFGEAVVLAHHLSSNGYDHLHCHFGNSGSNTGLLAARLAGIGFSLTVHGSELHEADRFRLAEKVAAASFVVCVSHYGRAQLMRITPPEAWSKLHVVRCGPPRDIEFREMPRNERLEVLCVGRLSGEKGHAVCLEAFEKLRDRRVPAHLTLVGDGPMRSTIADRASAAGISEDVTMTGSLPPDRVAELYQTCDLVVLPSFSEGVPVVLMEAMATGRPVVASRVGGIPELVTDGVSGLLVAPGDPDALAEAIARIAGDPGAAAEMGRRGASDVREHFNLEQSAEQLMTLMTTHGGSKIGWQPEPPPAQQRVANLLVISPVRNESEYIQRTIDSMVAQRVRPRVWIVVDDGSSDRTPEIVGRAAASHEWIRLYRRSDRGVRKVGGGVVDAFNEGLDQYDLDDFEYVCKFDGDLAFGPRYFELLFEKFAADPKLGTASGKSWIEHGDGYVPERTSDDFSQGQTKLYRTACFKEIGGFVREVMWDGIDCHSCRIHGWKAKSFRDPELRFIHLRPMGSSFRSIYHGRLRWGYGQYFMGTHPLYALAIACYRMFEKPWLIGGPLILAGYVGGYLKRKPRYDNPAFRRFLRRWQLSRLHLTSAPEGA